ncbi:asparaginase [Paenibacillus koleovorans]|uniref:asparaginase n=1 Tax=Paenibacillus koleovorans TaxID=121608 RepID=UPI001FEA4530|nr:asparaginase [Paenibacillus koleovorans]
MIRHMAALSSISAPLARVTRGPLTESQHRGHAAVVDRSGHLLAGLGDPMLVTFARSSAKPLQAIPVVESGAAEAYRLGPDELALLCASHNGEPAHIQAVERLLKQMGVTVHDLGCGPHYPYYEPEADRMKASGERPTRLHNNCSGKHSGMLALALRLGAPLEGYMAPEHPVQRHMLEAVAAMSGVPAASIALGTDGCGVPVFGLPLAALARAFAVFGRPDGLVPETREAACRQLLGALRAAPFYLAGTGRFDTRLIEATGGRLVGKMGAEGVFAVSAPERGEALAVKVEDGAQRALYPAVVEALRQLDWLTAAELEALREFHTPPVRNWAGDQVGAIVPDLDLRPAE